MVEWSTLIDLAIQDLVNSQGISPEAVTTVGVRVSGTAQEARQAFDEITILDVKVSSDAQRYCVIHKIVYEEKGYVDVTFEKEESWFARVRLANDGEEDNGYL